MSTKAGQGVRSGREEGPNVFAEALNEALKLDDVFRSDGLSRRLLELRILRLERRRDVCQGHIPIENGSYCI